MQNEEKWEAIARGLEQVKFTALADDEKSALPMRVMNTLDEMEAALLNGECSIKVDNRILRAIGRLNREMEQWQKLQRQKMHRPTISRRKAMMRAINRIAASSPHRKFR